MISRTIATVFIGLLASSVGLATSSCIRQPEASDCDIGSENCPCTTGGACNSGLTCVSDVCVNASDADAQNDAEKDASAADDAGKQSKADRDSASDSEASCDSYCGTPVRKCGLSTSIKERCVEDCYANQVNIPSGCESAWFAALACASDPDAWQCTSGDPQRIDCDEEEQASINCASGGDQTASGGGLSASCNGCLASCQGIGNCCAAKGCICESECQPTSCSPGSSLCCDYSGYCYCAASCPY